MKVSMKKKKRGFTLVEVIIVLAIIAIIAAIAVPNLTRVRQQSKEKADLRSLETIERIFNMLITDETITASSATYKLKFDNSSKKVNDVDGLTGDAASTAVDYLKDVRKPQTEGMKGIDIEVKSDGSIEAKLSTTTP